MDPQEIQRMVAATGEEIRDEQGAVVGYVAQPAKFRINRSYLARGGFLVVTRSEESGEYIGTEFDALAHPKSGEPYPAGHSEEVWRTADLNRACQQVLAYFLPSGLQ